ncbi:hypothetical protein [Mycobacterium marseillense]|uniref:Uncharacterized protein n=1 Tax=Mycobacterium marseillense TaxID=701042 RepID=A0ABM7J829_9MYCO|nr:hypothetical protein [Mycobacterium marseillense]MCV7403070.1 hypothetical protein [Mycobacterium marseillense]BBY09997.1 hypothetical protein MMARJ_07370 [Mycobacterium marseillense]
MFEYRLTAGVHHVWQLSRDGAVLDDELQTLSEVEDAVDDAVDGYCREHGVTVSLVRGGDGRRDVTMTHGAALSFTWVVVALECRCEDCGADTWDETYKVDEVLWATAGHPSGFLCIGCLEGRLGRALTPDDFADDERAEQARRPTSPRLRQRREHPRPPRPDITFHAPIAPVDLRAFNEVGEAYEIVACPECLPWRAEVVTDPQTNEILVREWHAVECTLFRELIAD